MGKRSDNFVKRRKHPKSLKLGTGGCNPCFRPSNEASKADLAEFHRENMGLRRAHQLKRQPNVRQPASGSIATANRHTGQPHANSREIARRRAA